jgi:hypothetical protein
MADASQAFTVVVNPGSTNLSPAGFNFDLGPCIVTRILVTWPPGTGGLVGVQIQAGASGAFPFNKQTYFVFDDYTYAFDVDNQIDSGNWATLVYNADTIQHGIQFVFEYDYLRGTQTSSNSQPVAI